MEGSRTPRCVKGGCSEAPPVKTAGIKVELLFSTA